VILDLYQATVDYLVVAGGGGAGSGGGGGGGAGGFRTNLSGHPLAGSPFPISVSPYPVVVGGGGVGQPFPGTGGIVQPGSNSVFSLVVVPVPVS
jgi:hypothetical protein